MGESELLTPAKIAERWGISADRLEKVREKLQSGRKQ